MRSRISNALTRRATIGTAIILAFILVGMVAFAIPIGENKKPGPCDGIQWRSPQERLACVYPNPPIGRWKAVYTKAFAKTHNLPPENISRDLSPGVDYMEMDVQPYSVGGVACLVNMLIKKPNDVSFMREETYPWERELHQRRRLAHLLELDAHKARLKRIGTFGLAPRHMKYDPHKTYGIGSSFAFYAEDIFPGYDYITANADCYNILSDPSRFPGHWAFNVAKASEWGRYHYGLYEMTRVKRPKDKKAFFYSRLSIIIPHEIIESVFEGMPIGGRQ